MAGTIEIPTILARRWVADCIRQTLQGHEWMIGKDTVEGTALWSEFGSLTVRLNRTPISEEVTFEVFGEPDFQTHGIETQPMARKKWSVSNPFYTRVNDVYELCRASARHELRILQDIGERFTD